ncbi:MAG: hypothetical protein H6815_04535 [Phycisphaeraceae bacterium]|nr:hypothetical protein [Phycisphaerales bacterium]MCB9859700.1 hypothetical protein [Phycisphaeraceae bacterium]
MIRTQHFTPILVLAAACSCNAQTPQLGGPMEHIGVELVGTQIQLHVLNAGPMLMQNYGETYTGAASVLNGMSYNGQFGWLAQGFWQPPAGSQVWIEQISAEPDMDIYMGGTFAPIFGTDNSSMRINWNGTMLHNWYATAVPGTYEIEYRVYLGDSAGVPTPGYEAGFVTLSWMMESMCYADCDGSGGLNIFDYICYGNEYAAGNAYADCDGSGSLNIFDYICFGNAYAAGCP